MEVYLRREVPEDGVFLGDELHPVCVLLQRHLRHQILQLPLVQAEEDTERQNIVTNLWYIGNALEFAWPHGPTGHLRQGS